MTNEDAKPANGGNAIIQPHIQGASNAAGQSGRRKRGEFWALTLGSVGVVYGDIGTSPLYALKESLLHTAQGGVIARQNVIAVVSLILWALIIVVTLKYVFLILRADNKGEGGTLSLMALAQAGGVKAMGPVFILGVAGAALFYGDAIITPAISVLSAVEGLKVVTPVFEPFVLPITIAIIAGLFFVQSRGTARVAAYFGPITTVWFLVIGGLGLWHIGDDPGVLAALNPLEGAQFMVNHGGLAFIVVGSVFLAVTGAEALYADMGHFGRKPIRLAWLALVFPALALNYLGQGAMLMANPKAIESPFFLMAPAWGVLPLVVLATLATIIASQAVITGAFSLTQQAISLGLLPRMRIRHTSETLAGQIYIPAVNLLLFAGVIGLVLSFRNSSALASAYGVAVTGTMVNTTCLAFIVARRVWKWSLPAAAGLILPLLAVDIAFLSSNLLKVLDGGYVPLLLGSLIAVIMWTWSRGSKILSEISSKGSITMKELVSMLAKSHPHRVSGTAVFLTSDTSIAPAALMHNLKHNRVLHANNILMSIHTADTPRVKLEEQFAVTSVAAGIQTLNVRLGYMQTPQVPLLLSQARRQGLEFDIQNASFFLGRRTLKASARGAMPIWQDYLYIGLHRIAATATAFFHIPSGRVVELGDQVHL